MIFSRALFVAAFFFALLISSMAVLVSVGVRLLLKNTQHFLTIYTVSVMFLSFFIRMNVYKIHSSLLVPQLTFIAHELAMYPHWSCDETRVQMGKKGRQKTKRIQQFLYFARVKIIALVALHKCYEWAQKKRTMNQKHSCFFFGVSASTSLCSMCHTQKKNTPTKYELNEFFIHIRRAFQHLPLSQLASRCQTAQANSSSCRKYSNLLRENKSES